MRPDALDSGAVHRLAADGVYAVASAGEATAQARPGIVLATAEGGKLLAQARRPEVPVAEDHAARAGVVIRGRGECLPVARRQLHLIRPPGQQARVPAEAIASVASQVVVAVGRLAPLASAARSAGELADRQGDAINDGRSGSWGIRARANGRGRPLIAWR